MTQRMRGVLAVFLLAGCSAQTIDPSPSTSAGGTESAPVAPITTLRPSPSTSAAITWEEPRAYSFTVDSRCGEGNFIGRFAVAVENGAVASVEPLDDTAGVAVRFLEPEEVPTLGEMLDRVEEARAEGASKVEVVTEPEDGRPVSVRIDWWANAIDDEECYEISDYSARGE